jgi:hypothetical protein
MKVPHRPTCLSTRHGPSISVIQHSISFVRLFAGRSPSSRVTFSLDCLAQTLLEQSRLVAIGRRSFVLQDESHGLCRMPVSVVRLPCSRRPRRSLVQSRHCADRFDLRREQRCCSSELSDAVRRQNQKHVQQRRETVRTSIGTGCTRVCS